MNTPSNISTAKLRIKILEYVCESEYYPGDWFLIDELEKEMINNLISVQEYNKNIAQISKKWL